MLVDFFLFSIHIPKDILRHVALGPRHWQSPPLHLPIWTYISGRAGHPPPEAGSLPGLPLDRIVEFFGLQPGFLKVDVEGFEQEGLEGAKQTVVRHRPILLVQMHKFQAGYPGACAWLKAWLNSLGYLGQKFFESDGITRTLWKPHPTGNSHIVSK